MHKTIAFILHFLLFTMMIMLSACASGPSSPSLTPAQQATLDVPNASATPKLIPSATITPIPTSLSNILVGDWMLAGVIADDRTINKAVLFQILSANKLQIPDFADTPLKIFSDNSFLLNLTLKNASFQEQQIMGGKYKKINDGYEFELENIGLQKNETYRLSGVYIIDNLLIFPKWFGQSEKWVFIKKSDLIRNPTSTLKPFGEIGGVRWSLAGFAPLQYISNQLYIPASEITEAQKAMTKQWANDYYKQFKSSPAPFLQNPLFVFFLMTILVYGQSHLDLRQIDAN